MFSSPDVALAATALLAIGFTATGATGTLPIELVLTGARDGAPCLAAARFARHSASCCSTCSCCSVFCAVAISFGALVCEVSGDRSHGVTLQRLRRYNTVRLAAIQEVKRCQKVLKEKTKMIKGSAGAPCLDRECPSCRISIRNR